MPEPVLNPIDERNRWHHSNSRRFRCECGRVHEWGRLEYERDYWKPRHGIHCPCGLFHVRGDYRGPWKQRGPW